MPGSWGCVHPKRYSRPLAGKRPLALLRPGAVRRPGWRYLTVTVPDSTVRPCTVQKNEKLPARGKRTEYVPMD
jgi:hypothetical protein